MDSTVTLNLLEKELASLIQRTLPYPEVPNKLLPFGAFISSTFFIFAIEKWLNISKGNWKGENVCESYLLSGGVEKRIKCQWKILLRQTRLEFVCPGNLNNIFQSFRSTSFFPLPQEIWQASFISLWKPSKRLQIYSQKQRK